MRDGEQLSLRGQFIVRLVAAAALSFALVSSALAAQAAMPLTRPAHPGSGLFSTPEAIPNAIALDGDIGEGAAEAYLAALRRRSGADTLIVNSDGGRVWEALQIARYVHLGKLHTLIPSGRACYSACAYIFLAGTTRTIEAGGRLGVHQIYGNSDPSETQVTLAYVFDALRDFGVADGVISTMLRTAPGDMHEFTADEIVEFGLTTRAANSAAAAVATIDAANTEGGQSLLLEASDDGKTGAVPFSGSVEWSGRTDEKGMATLVGKAWIPARNLSLDLLIRKNRDRSLPASHVIELRFKVGDSFTGGSIAGLPGVLLKNEELVQGTPLIGASARVVRNSFVFALSASPEDIASNRNLLTSRKYIDLALIYATGKRAIITLEKDNPAATLLKEIFTERDQGTSAGASNVGKSARVGDPLGAFNFPTTDGKLDTNAANKALELIPLALHRRCSREDRRATPILSLLEAMVSLRSRSFRGHQRACSD